MSGMLLKPNRHTFHDEPARQYLLAYASSPHGHVNLNFPPCVRQAFNQAETPTLLIQSLRRWTRNPHKFRSPYSDNSYYRIDQLMQAVAPVWCAYPKHALMSPDMFLAPATLIPYCLADALHDDARFQVVSFFDELFLEAGSYQVNQLRHHDIMHITVSDSYEAYMHPLLIASDEQYTTMETI